MPARRRARGRDRVGSSACASCHRTAPASVARTGTPARRRPTGRPTRRSCSDALGIDRCAVMGWSAGGQYALGVAARLGARVTHTAVIAGCVPLDDPGRRKELSKLDQRFVVLSTRTPWLARWMFATLGRSAARHPDRTAERSVKGLPDAPSAPRSWRRATGWAARWPRRCTIRAVRSTTTGRSPRRGASRRRTSPVRSRSGRATATGWSRPCWATVLCDRLPGQLVDCLGEDHFVGLTRRADVLRSLHATAP